MRHDICRLLHLGSVPNSNDCDWYWDEFETIVDHITPPLSNDEAQAMLSILGASADYNGFGLARVLVHLIETAPSALPSPRPDDLDGYWVRFLYDRQSCDGGKALAV